MRPIASQQRKIEGVGDVYVTPFGARTALRLTTRLSRHVMPALERLMSIDVAPEALAKLQIGLEQLVGPLQRLLEGLDDEAFDWLVLNILRGTSVVSDGRKHDLDTNEKIDAAFGADMIALLRVCACALEVNYGDFIGLLRAVAGKAQQAKAAREAAAAPASPESSSSSTTT